MNKKHLVQFLLLDENFDGAVRATLDNWNGLAYRIPRLRLNDYADRNELSFSGVYLLFGKEEATDEDARAGAGAPGRRLHPESPQ